MSGDPDPPRIQQPPERVVPGVEACLDAAGLLGLVARARIARGHRGVRVRRVGEEEVEGVLGPVEERAPVALRGDPLPLIGRLPGGVGLALPLRVPGHDDVAVLGQRLRGIPVHVLVGLHRAVGDDDSRPLRRAGPGGPDVPGDGGAVARGVQDGLNDSVAARLPLVETDVARTAILLAPAQVIGEHALGVARLRQQRRLPIDLALGAKLRLVGRGQVDRLALAALGVILRLGDRVERARRRGRKQHRPNHQHQQTPPPHDHMIPRTPCS